MVAIPHKDVLDATLYSLRSRPSRVRWARAPVRGWLV